MPRDDGNLLGVTIVAKLTRDWAGDTIVRRRRQVKKDTPLVRLGGDVTLLLWLSPDSLCFVLLVFSTGGVLFRSCLLSWCAVKQARYVPP